MTVKQLIKKLSQLEPNRLVILSSDPEGNGFDELNSLSTCAYNKETRESGMESLTAADKQAGYSEEDIMEDGVPALCLWP